jgi:seryl-tRNA synthetase
MLFIRENEEKVADAVVKKGIDLDLKVLLKIDKERIALLQEVEQLLALKNDLNEMMKRMIEKFS